MAVRRPLVLIDGTLKELPTGDLVAGVSGGTAWKEPVSVYNAGNPQLVFLSDGTVVVSEVS
jgi:hypothetical protein